MISADTLFIEKLNRLLDNNLDNLAFSVDSICQGTNQIARLLALFASVALLIAGCNAPARQEGVLSKADMAAVKTEIQALENEWADALSKQDIPKLLSFYADDAVQMNANEPMHVGKAAIQEALTQAAAAPRQWTTATFETMDVFGDGNVVTEVGKTTLKDAAGKVVSTGKYVGVFEKRDGKYFCLRDINNQDQPEK